MKNDIVHATSATFGVCYDDATFGQCWLEPGEYDLIKT